MVQSPTPQIQVNSSTLKVGRLLALLLTIACLTILTAIEAIGQDRSTRGAVAQLDSDIQTLKPAELTSVYLTNPYQKIADVPSTLPRILVAHGNKWSTVQFTQPTVPGWVSQDFIRLDDEVGTVLANVLNVRLRPSPQSRVMTQLEAGYQSRIIGRYAGFFQILLPADFTVAVRQAVSESKKDANLQSKTDLEEPSERGVAPAQPLTQSTVSNDTVAQKPIQPQLASASQSSTPGFDAGSHRIAPGDAISLMVFGEPDLSIQNVRVPQSGQVSFPLVGPVTVAGKTTAMIETDMENLLEQGYVKNPRLSVTIFSYRPIFIRGGVSSTGAFPYTEGLTIAKAIALAGGSKSSALPNGVSILRDGVSVAEDLAIDSAFEVSSGDVISVAEGLGQEASGSFIYIHGEVQQPGEYIYRRGLTVEKAIVLASGFSLRASKRKVSITRYAGRAEDEPPIEMNRVELFTPVEPGDVINVGASWF